MFGNHVMEVNDLRIGLHLTTALVDRHEGGREVAHGLPPHGPTQVHDLADYPGAPEDWVRAEGPSERSYFFGVPRRPERGIWFEMLDLMNDRYDVAVRISKQGVCAKTGRPSDRSLEWYNTRCPNHDVPFTGNRFCSHPECQHEWPATNFYSTTGARREGTTMWVDGFRNSKGEVRQAIFVDDPARGVAAQLIGDARVPAFGFVFVRSARPKPRSESVVYRGGGEVLSYGGHTRSFGGKRPEVAAGALVSQRHGEDDKGSAYWSEETAGIIRLYFAWEDEVAEILKSRRQPAAQSPSRDGGNGFLRGRRVGNPGNRQY